MLHRNVGIQLSTGVESCLRRTERAAMPLRKTAKLSFPYSSEKKAERRFLNHALFGDMTSHFVIISCIPCHSAHNSACFRQLTALTFK